MFTQYHNILAVKSSFLYNKELYERVISLKKDVDKYLNSAMQDEFMIAMQQLNHLKELYKNDDATFLTNYNYKNYLKSGKIKRLVLGGNGREALIKWNSIPSDIQAKVIDYIGYDPADKHKSKPFSDSIEIDPTAIEFFRDYRKSNGESLNESQQLQYVARSSVFNAITQLIDTRSKQVGNAAKSTTLWRNISEVLQNLDKNQYPHKLPKNHRRLKDAWQKYVKDGYVGVLHKGLENDNSIKIKGDVADWFISMYSLPNKPKVTHVMERYNAIRALKNFPTLTENAVYSWLHSPEIERIWYLGRHGSDAYADKFGHKIKRKRSEWFPNAYWAIDGSKLDFFHFDENSSNKIGSKIRINVCVDIYSEMIIGWSYSFSESHEDHFKAIKMSVNTSGARPYLFTYDNQSGHKSSKMQELYSNLVARKGGTHYAHKAKAHNSPVENIFARLQQQVLSQLYFSDKQSITAKTLDSRPNPEFIIENKHHLKSVDELNKVWEMCVKLWNESKHPKHKELTRTEVYSQEAPMQEIVDITDMVDMFWIYNNRSIKYRKEGLKLTVGNRTFDYEVLNDKGMIDVGFRRKYVGHNLIVKYDPEHLNDFVVLYKEDAQGNRVFVANAQPKRTHEVVPALMQEGDKESWKRDYEVRNIEKQLDLAELEAARRRSGITPEKLIEEQEAMMKLGSLQPKTEAIKSDSTYSRM